VTLTYRRRKKAIIIPCEESTERDAVDQHPAFGMWKDRSDLSDVTAFARRLRRGMNHVVQAFLPAFLLAAQASADPAFLSDGPQCSARIYSVYDPHYGRATPEVKRNTNGRGNPLRISGTTFAKGFGAWRFSVIEIDVPDNAKGIAGLVGIDVEKGRRYGITYRARQEGLDSTVGAAVFNLTPWENCSIEHKTVVDADWREYRHDFTAKRDSDQARLEFYFTETGTVWLEGMRLEAVGE